MGRAFFLLWANVPDADCFVVTRTLRGPVTLPSGSTSYLSSDAPPDGDIFDDLTTTKVHPIILSVVAYEDGKAIRLFTHGVPCPSLVYVAARGSGQNGMFTEPFARGLGDRGMHVLEGLREALGKDQYSMPAIAVDYPALAVAFNSSMQMEIGSYPYFYNKSVQAGVENGQRVIALTAKICPKSRFVLFGYSQGAQVMGDIFTALTGQERAQVARIILFADATYSPGDPRVVYLPTAPAGKGIKGTRHPFPESPRTIVESWCWDQDAVCQRPPYGHAFHGDIYDQYEKGAIHNAATGLR